ncbi:DUF4401 domain-containing protein [Kaarinaea lacus]
MSERHGNFQDVFTKLAEENLLDSDWEPKARALLAREHNEQPWYVRIMVGFSAWLASWMLIGFVVGAAIVESEQATLILGVILVVGAVVGRCVSDNDFITQVALAVSLAGEALIVFGVAQMSDSIEITVLSFIGLELVLVAFYPDIVHRFLSAASIIVALTILLFQWKALDWVHLIVIAFAIFFVVLVHAEEQFLARGQSRLLAPVKWGVLFGQLGVLMLSTIYIVPELSRSIELFPNPWISSIGLGLLLLYLVYQLINSVDFNFSPANTAAVYASCLVVVVASVMVPGLIMALILLLLGFVKADRVLMGVAIGFFVVFLTAFFYGIELTLLMKSIVLIATGLVLLAGRYGLKFYLAAQKEIALNE